MRKDYHTPKVRVKRKIGFTLTKCQLIEHVAKDMQSLCTRDGSGCTNHRRCRYGWLCEEINHENVGVGHLDKLQLKPTLTAVTVKALLRFTGEVGAGELFDAYVKHVSNPRNKSVKYNSLVAGADINLSLSRTEGIRRILNYVGTLV